MISIQFLSLRGIEMGDSVTAGFSCRLAFASGFPVTLCSTPSSNMVSDVSVTYLLIPFTIRTHEAVPVSKQRLDQNFNTVTLMMKTDLHIQDRADFRISDFSPPCSGCFFTSRQCTLSTSILHFIWSFFFIKYDEELSLFNNLQTSVAAQFG